MDSQVQVRGSLVSPEGVTCLYVEQEEGSEATAVGES